jgi:hypothetical protein
MLNEREGDGGDKAGVAVEVASRFEGMSRILRPYVPSLFSIARIEFSDMFPFVDSLCA